MYSEQEVEARTAADGAAELEGISLFSLSLSSNHITAVRLWPPALSAEPQGGAMWLMLASHQYG